MLPSPQEQKPTLPNNSTTNAIQHDNYPNQHDSLTTRHDKLAVNTSVKNLHHLSKTDIILLSKLI